MRGWFRFSIPILVATVTLFTGARAFAQQTTRMVYACDLGGQPAQLVADVTPVGDGAGGYNLQIAGQLVSQTARYSFTGENAYADFTDLIRNERFRVQFVTQGNILILIANPQGPGPTQYRCQRTG
jgi:hypothetical protein